MGIVEGYFSLNGRIEGTFKKSLGRIPVMVRSRACWLYGKKKNQLFALGEEDTEFGGYFICGGIERLIRLLIVPRRNYIIAMRRDAYLKYGPRYTNAACALRCVRSDS